jgi:hypothetical protein
VASFPRFVPPASRVEFTPGWHPRTWELTGIVALLLGLLTGVAFALFADRGSLAGERYHLWRWQTETLTSTVFARLGIGPDPDAAAGEQAVRSYFRITSQLRTALDTDPANVTLIDALVSERSVYENDVERFVEGAIADAVREAGLTRSLPLFNGVRILWPPVDFELTTPPQLLVRSPRDRIERSGDTLLQPGLTFAEIEEIERKTEDDDTSTIVVSIGGLAAYPAIVTADRSYDGLLDTAAHEWVHHYLAFYPLGEAWGQGGDAYTLNETTAELAGREIANLVRKNAPIELPSGEDGRALPRTNAPPVTIDFNTEMRTTRLEVDRLLAEGKVDEAERYMEERRRFLEEHGISIRRLNQAYFAFYGTYASGPASSDPIGPKVNRVWELTGDVGVFLAVMREVATVEQLDRAIAALEAVGADGK